MEKDFVVVNSNYITNDVEKLKAEINNLLPPAMAGLVNEQIVETICIKTDEFSVGRSPECDLILEDDNMKDEQAHFLWDYDSYKWMIKRNEFVEIESNGKVLPYSEKVELQHGAIITFDRDSSHGKRRFKFIENFNIRIQELVSLSQSVPFPRASLTWQGVMLEGMSAPPKVYIDKNPFTIGSGEKSDFVIKNAGVDKEHFTFAYCFERKKWIVHLTSEDVQWSTINGQLTPLKSYALENGTLFSFSGENYDINYSFKFALEGVLITTNLKNTSCDQILPLVSAALVQIIDEKKKIIGPTITKDMFTLGSSTECDYRIDDPSIKDELAVFNYNRYLCKWSVTFKLSRGNFYINYKPKPGFTPIDVIDGTILTFGGLFAREYSFSFFEKTPAPLRMPAAKNVFRCPICRDYLQNPSSLLCGHVYCHNCVLLLISIPHVRPKCSVCLLDILVEPKQLPKFEKRVQKYLKTHGTKDEFKRWKNNKKCNRSLATLENNRLKENQALTAESSDVDMLMDNVEILREKESDQMEI